MRSLLMFLCLTVASMAQGQQPSIEAAQKATLEKPNDAAAWENYGLALLANDKVEAAIEPLQKAVTLGFSAPTGNYNLACAYARLNTPAGKEKAIELVRSVATNPGGGQFAFAADPDLASLRSDERFQQIMNDLRGKKFPCEDHQAHPEYRQLDFWVGEWNVFNTQKQQVGTSSVQSILKDCVVLENWKDMVGGEGKSFNKFNTSLQKWEQFWVQDNGGTTHYTGQLEDGKMMYLAESKTPAGASFLRRLSFTPIAADKVRQFEEISTDGGKTWTVGYDFLYVRKKDSAAAKIQ